MTGRGSCRVAATTLLAAAVLAGAGCGHKGKPEPPLPRLPEPPRDVQIRQRGSAIEIDASFTLAGLGGRDLSPPVRPVLLVLPGASGAATWDRPTRAREFARIARAFPLPEFDVDRLGASFRSRLTLPASALERGGGYVVALAIEDRRRRSMPSSRVALIPAFPALEKLESLQALPREQGIEVRWGDVPDESSRVRIFRALDGGEFGALPWREVTASDRFVFDGEVEYGQAVAYAAVASKSSAGAPVESDPVTVTIDSYDDTFPPRPPQDLTGAVEAGRIRLFWFPGGSEDDAEIAVEREVRGSGQFEEVGRVAPRDATFEDLSVEGDRDYRYRVRGIDLRGNVSEWAGPTDWLRPREDRSTEDDLR